MLQSILSNPVMAIVIVVVAILLGKVFKFSAKVIEWILLIGIAYVIVTSLGIF